MGRAQWWLEDPKRFLIALAVCIALGSVASVFDRDRPHPPTPQNPIIQQP